MVGEREEYLLGISGVTALKVITEVTKLRLLEQMIYSFSNIFKINGWKAEYLLSQANKSLINPVLCNF